MIVCGDDPNGLTSESDGQDWLTQR
jgi:hypothetical protein